MFPSDSDSGSFWLLSRLAVLILFIGLSVVILYPRSIQMLGYLHDGPDPKVLIWTMWWVQHQLLEDPLNLFRANIFYPHTDALAYSDSLIVQSILVLPLRLFTNEPTILFNASFVIAFALSGFGMFLLVRYLTGRTAIAIIAGIFFAFSPYRLDNVTHLQYASQQWLPFLLYGLLKFFKERKPGWAFATMGFLWLQAMSCATYVVMLGLPLLLFVAMLWLRYRPGWKEIAWLAAAGLAFVIFLAPFYYPIWNVTQGLGIQPDPDQVALFSPDLLDYAKQPKYMTALPYQILPKMIKTPYFSLFPGFLASAAIVFAVLQLFGSRTKRESTIDKSREQTYFVISRTFALAFTALAVCALTFVALSISSTSEHNTNNTFLTSLIWIVLVSWIFTGITAALQARIDQSRNDTFRLWLFLAPAIMCGLFALGPYIYVGGFIACQSVFWPLNAFVPGFKMIRQVMHFNTVFMLFASVAAGLGLKKLYDTNKKTTVIILAALFVWIGFEYQTDMSRDYVEVPLRAPELYRMLAAEPKESPFIEFPVWPYPHHQEADRMYWSMYHGKPFVTGQSSYWPIEYEWMVRNLRSFPSKESVEFLKKNYRLRYVVVRTMHYRVERIRQAKRLLRSNGYKFLGRYDKGYFLLFEDSRWEKSMYYTVEPPRPEDSN